ncbi:MAG: ROK family protein, partial [Desulfobacterota bacterium]|nr:ROK family protein [Thermodesulfobacteriota bacterium]
ITVDPRGAKCNCGNKGCLEALASGNAIKREAIKVLLNHPESEIYKRCQGKIENITPEITYQSARANDPFAQKIYQEMGRYLGIGIASLINIFNPEMVIIGGGISKAWEAFFPSTQKEVQLRALKIPTLRVRLVPATRPDDSGLFGAAYSVFKYIGLLD